MFLDKQRLEQNQMELVAAFQIQYVKRLVSCLSKQAEISLKCIVTAESAFPLCMTGDVSRDMEVHAGRFSLKRRWVVLPM